MSNQFPTYGLTTNGEIKVQSPDSVSPIVADKTFTVGTGKDFTTIQAAIDYFEAEKFVGDNVIIDVDAGAYVEDVLVNNLHVDATSHLVLRGDQRDLAGMAWIDGGDCNRGGITNGGSGVMSLSNSGTVLTVTGATTNPNFSADGWGNGDTCYLSGNSGGVSGYTISSTSGNTITMTTTIVGMGNDGTGLQLRPDRRIAAATNQALQVSGAKLTLEGFHLMGPGLGSAQAVQSTNGADLRLNNCCWTHSYYGAMASWGGQLQAPTTCSGFYNTINGYAFNMGRLYLTYANHMGHLLAGSYGLYSGRRGFIEAYGAVAGGYTTHFAATEGSFLYAISSYARGNGSGTGFLASGNGTLLAHATNGKHNVATPYSPSPTIPGWATNASHGVLYASTT